MRRTGWLKVASTLLAHSAPSPAPHHLKAEAAPARRPSSLGGLPRPQSPATGRPKVELFPRPPTGIAALSSQLVAKLEERIERSDGPYARLSDLFLSGDEVGGDGGGAVHCGVFGELCSWYVRTRRTLTRCSAC